MTLINQPQGTGTVRKVQWATWASAMAAPVAALFAYPLAVILVSFIPFWNSEAGFEAARVLIEMFLTGLMTGLATWTAGYMARARVGEFGQ